MATTLPPIDEQPEEEIIPRVDGLTQNGSADEERGERLRQQLSQQRSSINRQASSPAPVAKPQQPAQTGSNAAQGSPTAEGGKRANWLSRSINNLSTRRNGLEQVAKNATQSAAKKVAKGAVKSVATKAVAGAAAPEVAIPLMAADYARKHWRSLIVKLLALNFFGWFTSISISIVIIAILIAIGQSGIFGSSFHSQASQNNELQALSNAGDIFARRQLDAQDIPLILKAMDAVESQSKAKKPPDTDALTIATSIRAKLASYSSSGGKVDTQTLVDVQALMAQLSAKGYSGVAASDIGQKIATLAVYYANDPTGKQKYQSCSVSDKTACNQFSIKVMHETGADPSFNGLAIEQYHYTQSRPDCYTVFSVSDTSNLAVGDLLFRSTPNQFGIGHVAIYIGNGRIAAASVTTSRSIGHPPQIGHWYAVLNVAARLKVASCPAKA